MFIVNKKSNSLSAEAYRSIKTNLEYSSVDKKLKTLVVTSSEPGEGKSTVCGNLAYVLSQGGKKVLVIDADLRKPTLHKRFKVDNEIGLTDLLIGKANNKKFINKITDDINLITSGQKTPNPAEMVSSEAMERLLEEYKEQYDYVIIDTPPVLTINDGRVLATKCDGTIFVIKAGQSKKHNILNAYRELEIVKANVVGSVLNGVDNSINGYYYYYYES